MLGRGQAGLCRPWASADDSGIVRCVSCSRRDIAKLKGQHSWYGLSADRLERKLYDRGQGAPARGRGKTRRTWSQVVSSIWGTLSDLSMESISMPRREFALGLASAVYDRNHASFLAALAGKPELALFQRIYEGPGF